MGTDRSPAPGALTMNRTVVSKAMWTLGLLLASAVAHAADPQPLEVDPDA